MKVLDKLVFELIQTVNVQRKKYANNNDGAVYCITKCMKQLGYIIVNYNTSNDQDLPTIRLVPPYNHYQISIPNNDNCNFLLCFCVSVIAILDGGSVIDALNTHNSLKEYFISFPKIKVYSEQLLNCFKH